MRMRLLKLWIYLVNEDSGQDLVEYALLVVLIGLVIAAALPALTTAISAAFGRVATCLSGAPTATGCPAQ